MTQRPGRRSAAQQRQPWASSRAPSHGPRSLGAETSPLQCLLLVLWPRRPKLPSSHLQPTVVQSATSRLPKAAASATPTATASVSWHPTVFTCIIQRCNVRVQHGPTSSDRRDCRQAVALRRLLVGAGGTASPPPQNKCAKCNVPVAQGGCKCNSNCDCIGERYLPSPPSPPPAPDDLHCTASMPTAGAAQYTAIDNTLGVNRLQLASPTHPAASRPAGRHLPNQAGGPGHV